MSVFIGIVAILALIYLLQIPLLDLMCFLSGDKRDEEMTEKLFLPKNQILLFLFYFVALGICFFAVSYFFM